MNYSFAGGWRKYKEEYTLHPFEKTYFGYSLNFSQTFKLPANFSAELSGWYNNTSYNGTTKVDGYDVLNIGFKKELKNNGGSFQLSVSDLLRNESFNVYYGSLTQEAFFIKSHVYITTESAKSQIIKLTYSRSFGDNNLKGQRKQSNGSEDERERITK